MKFHGMSNNGKCVKCGKKALRQDFRCKKCSDEFVASMPDVVRSGRACSLEDDETPVLRKSRGWL